MENTSESEIDEDEESYNEGGDQPSKEQGSKEDTSDNQHPLQDHTIPSSPQVFESSFKHIYANVNIMPKSVYQMMFNDPEVKHLADDNISLGVYTDYQVNFDILGKCKLFMLHPDTKKPHAVTFYAVSNEGSVLLSCTTLLALDLI